MLILVTVYEHYSKFAKLNSNLIHWIWKIWHLTIYFFSAYTVSSAMIKLSMILSFKLLFSLNQFKCNGTIPQITAILWALQTFQTVFHFHIFTTFSCIRYIALSLVLSLSECSSLKDCHGFCEFSCTFMGLILSMLLLKLWLHLKFWRLWFCLKIFDAAFF